MALSSTLFTGLSGLGVNQTRLNVVGNNIANVNTIGFKASRALFKPQFYVTDSNGSPPSDNFGGTNPNQRGLGASVASIEKNFSAGSIEPTGRATDFAIDGNGFFIVQGGERFYTRDGSFTLNSRNELVTGSGLYVQGYGIDDNEQIIPGLLGNVQIPIGGLTKAEATRNAFLTGNLNAGGELSRGASILESGVELFAGGGGPVGAGTLLTDVQDAGAVPQFAIGDTLSAAGTSGGRTQQPLEFVVGAGSTMADLMSFFEQGLAIQPGVQPGTTLTSGAQLKAGPTTGTTLVLVGNTGAANAITVQGSAFAKNGLPMFGFVAGTDAGGNEHGPAGESIQTSLFAYDSLGQPIEVGISLDLQEKTDTGTTWRFKATSPGDTDYLNFAPGGPGQLIGGGTVRFDNSGRLIGADGDVLTISRVNTGAAVAVDIQLNFTEVTALASPKGSELFAQQDGSRIGTLVDFTIGDSGIITGSFDNGLTATLGQIALATFDNPQGLSDNGGNLFSTGGNSGEPRIGAPLEGLAGGIRAGALELSNVDLSNEFINLIIASTGFSAASRVISTSDQLMRELLNTSR